MEKVAWFIVSIPLAMASPAHAQAPANGYSVGQQVSFSISGRPEDSQPCTVAENPPSGLMRVRCGAFKQWSAGVYIVYSPDNLRPSAQRPLVASPTRRLSRGLDQPRRPTLRHPKADAQLLPPRPMVV